MLFDQNLPEKPENGGIKLVKNNVKVFHELLYMATSTMKIRVLEAIFILAKHHSQHGVVVVKQRLKIIPRFSDDQKVSAKKNK